MGNPVVNNAKITTNEPKRLQNFEVIKQFFSLYLEPRELFYALWVEDEPVVYLPFTTEGVAVCKASSLEGWEAVKSFWDPIFDWKGKFDWTIDEVIFGEDPDVIITKARSDIDAQTGPQFNNVHLSYQGTYLQLFHFENGKVKSFEELYDTDFLNKQYQA